MDYSLRTAHLSFRTLRALFCSGVLVLAAGSQAQVATSYTMTPSGGTFTPITGGTALETVINIFVDIGSFDDNVSAAQTIPAFNFNGTSYTQMYVSNNGFITFGSAPTGTNYTPLSSTETYSGAISAFGCDINNTTNAITSTRDVRWQTVGNEVIVQWRGVRRVNIGSEGFSFQIRLNTVTNEIKIVYGPYTAGPAANTAIIPQVGLRGPNNTFATQVKNNLVASGAETWAAPLAGANNASNMRFTSTAPAKSWTSGQTYTYTPCATTVNVTPTSASVCTGSNVALTASGANTYAWSPSTGLSATTGTSVNASPSVNTTYTVIGTTTGCAFTGSATTTITALAGLNTPVITPGSATTCSGSPQVLGASATSLGTVNPSFNSSGGPATITTGAAQNASTYPWNITTSGLPTSGVTVASVTINGITHTFPDDLDILLQSPTGTNVILMSDVGDDNSMSNVNLTFATGSPALPDASAITSGTYAPTNFGTPDTWPTSPGPASLSQASPSLTLFTGNMNGAWKLLIRDDASGDGGSIAGWSITFAYAPTVTYSWSPNVALSATAGASVTASPTSTQMYTVTAAHNANACTRAANVTITVNQPANAGTNGTLTICSNAAAASLFAQLGGSPQGGGTWSGPSAVVGGMYNPATMNPGAYVYTVTGTSPCPNAQATVTVTENTATTWYADADGDGAGNPNVSQLACAQPVGYVANNADLCPLDPNKQAPGVCGCGVADVATTYYADTDGDGFGDPNAPTSGFTCIVPNGFVANNTDLCPTDINKQAPGVCGCGVADVATTYYADTDGDGFGDPNAPTSGFTCIVPNGFVANNTDLCPTDMNKQAPGQCGCGVPDTDTDTDGTADCTDGCPTDPNKIAPGACGCGVADVPTTWYADADGDNLGDPNSSVAGFTCIQPAGYVANNTDLCPAVSGTVGSICNDNNPFTSGDVLNASCVCTGTPAPCDNWTLSITTDAAGSQISWQIQDANSPFILASASGLANNTTVNTSICVPQGACFVLTVNDAGSNGITNGGYVLKNQNGVAVIDDTNNGAFGATSQSPMGFCAEVGTVRLTDYNCGRLYFGANENVECTPDATVSGQWNQGDQTDDGYQFWFFNPNGGYSRRILRSHAISGGFGPPAANRACRLAFSSIVSNPLPQDLLLNVRVRPLVNGSYGPFGPACQFRISTVPEVCPLTKLVDDPNNLNFSCGVTRTFGGSQKVVAYSVPGANKYRFQFAIPAEGFQRRIAGTSNAQLLNWVDLPLLDGSTYEVRVQSSYDNGATWCPFGEMCTVTISNNMIQNQQNALEANASAHLSIWPNPNRGNDLHLLVEDLGEEVATANVEIFDAFGKRVSATTLAVDGTTLNTTLSLEPVTASGLYVVTITAGSHNYREQVMIVR